MPPPTDGATPEAYARALLEVAESEGALQRLEDGLFRFARAVETNPQLADRLADPGIDLAPKLEVVDELLGAQPETASAVMWIIQSGRIRQLGAIADAVVRLGAESRQGAVAEVRAAVELSADQQRRLAEALRASLGQDVEVRVVVDPSVVGGLLVRIGDTVIDGTVARRLDEVRSALTGA
jgi:F-type H+-transporting ATPase subunit delta